MAFVNKKLSISEKKKISDMKIKNPYGNYRDIMEGITPSYITIDNSSNMWLSHCYTHKETLECIEEFIFIMDNQFLFKLKKELMARMSFGKSVVLIFQ